MEKRPEQYYRFATHVMQIQTEGESEEEVILEGISAFRKFLRSIGVPSTLKQMDIWEKDLPAIQEDVIKISFNAEGVLQCNPPVTVEDILEILKLAK